MIRVQEEPFDVAAELARLAEAAPDCGAILSFTGVVRAGAGSKAVTALELQHYPEFTQSGLDKIAQGARSRFAIGAVAIVHRYGRLEPKERIVFVGIASEHRRAGFEALDYVMDRLKTEAAFWKRERRPSGDRWVEASRNDCEDRERWDKEEQR